MQRSGIGAGGCGVGCALAVLMALGAVALAAGVAAQIRTVKGLDVRVTGVERASNVSLTDCPPGANSVRGVIKPGDPNEFASIAVDFTVTPAFKPGPLAKPVVYDEAGKAYNTAQSFADVGASPSFSCTFSFRVPKGAKLTRLAIETLSIDLSSLGQ